MNWKKILIDTLLSLTILTVFLVIPVVVVAGDLQIQPLLSKLEKLITDNWPATALILSEIAAFLPGKAKGILQGFIIVLGKLISLKKNKK